MKVFTKRKVKEFSQCTTAEKAEIFRILDITEKLMIFLFNGMLINFHHSLSFDKDTHSLFCNWVKNTSKLGKSNCASLCFCPHIGKRLGMLLQSTLRI
jgi:hypothetical protein